jgi:Zn-dependent protease with chaperone function
MKTPEVIENPRPSEYEHPPDAKALRALWSVPGMDTLIRQFNKHAIERYFTVKLKVTSRNLPNVYDTLRQCCLVTNCRNVPDLYIEWAYGINGYTIGFDHPIIVIQSGCVALLDEAELCCDIGHGVGHINSRHTRIGPNGESRQGFGPTGSTSERFL